MDRDKRRNSYDRQFKIDAVSLVVNGGRSVSQVARDLGIDAHILYPWKREWTNSDEANAT